MEWKPLNKILPPLQEGDEVCHIDHPGLRLKVLDGGKTPYVSDSGVTLCSSGLYALSPNPKRPERRIYQTVENSFCSSWARAEHVNVDLDKFM